MSNVRLKPNVEVQAIELVSREAAAVVVHVTAPVLEPVQLHTTHALEENSGA